MNIEFGKNINNKNKVKKVYNKGNIIITRPQTAKYPYKILSIKEFPKSINDDKKLIKKPKRNNDLNSINMKKSFSYVENLQIENIKKNKNKLTKGFNHSYHDTNNNFVLHTNNKLEYNEEDFINRIFTSDRGKVQLYSMNNDSYNDFGIKKNRKLVIKRGFSSNSNNKKRVSSFSMSKYIEKYINNGNNNGKNNVYKNDGYNKSININNYNNNAYKINDDDNTQIIHFLSEIINTEKLNKNIIYQTTYNKNKNKNNTRNLIIKKYYYNNKNKISLSDAKNPYDDIKPVIINVQEKFNLSKINKDKKNYKSNDFLLYKKKFENATKLRKNLKISSFSSKTENNEKRRAFSIETEKSIYKKKEKSKENNNDKNKKDNGFHIDKNKIKNIKYKIKNKHKKKLKLNKEFKVKNKKRSNIFKNHEINNGFLKYLNHFKKDKNYIGKSNNYRGIRYGKKCDIYDYLLLPKESEKNDEALNKDYSEFKSVNQ